MPAEPARGSSLARFAVGTGAVVIIVVCLAILLDRPWAKVPGTWRAKSQGGRPVPAQYTIELTRLTRKATIRLTVPGMNQGNPYTMTGDYEVEDHELRFRHMTEVLSSGATLARPDSSLEIVEARWTTLKVRDTLRFGLGEVVEFERE